MANQLNQGSKNNKTKPRPKFIFGAMGVFIIMSGLIALSVLYKFWQQPSLPIPAIDPTKIALEIEVTSMSGFLTHQPAQPLSTDPTKIALEIDATAMRNFLTSQAATLWPSTQPSSTTPTSAFLTIPLLTNENDEYALRYPSEYHVVFFGRSICFTLAQTDSRPSACHVANAILDVSDAEGRTLANAADELAANGNPSVEITRTNMEIGGENAILLDNIYTYDVLRQLVVIHNNRIYVFTFAPWVAGIDEFQRLQPLYSTLISSFTFLDKP